MEFRQKTIKAGLIFFLSLAMTGSWTNSFAQSETSISAIEKSNLVLDNSYYKIENDDFTVGLGNKLEKNDDVINFQAYPKKEVGNDLFSKTSDWLTRQKKGISFELIKAVDQKDIEQEINQIKQEYSQENDQTGVTGIIGNLWTKLTDNFWGQLDGIKNIGNSNNDLSQIKTNDGLKIISQTENNDISLEYQSLENGLKENILVEAGNGGVFDNYLYKLNLDSGVILHRAQSDAPFGLPEGIYYFTDENNNYIAHFLPLVAFDSNGLKMRNVSMEILPVGAIHELPLRYVIVITVDKNWLTDPALQYPIRIDPTIIHDTKTEFDAGTLNRLEATSANRTQLKQHELSANSSTVGLWHMNESTGQVANDATGNSNNGQLGSAVGSDSQDPTWNTTSQKFGASALTYDGTDDEVKVTDVAGLKLQKEMTVEAWVKGQGANLFTNTYTSTGFESDAIYQVVGNKIYFLWIGPSYYSDIHTGLVNTDGTGWTYTRQTNTSTSKSYPKMQVVGNKIYYCWLEISGSTKTFWTATMNTDGTGWSATQRFSSTTFYLSDPEIQVVGSKIYYAGRYVPSSGATSIWTATMNTDGTGWSYSNRSTGSIYSMGVPLNQHVIGSKIYYLWTMNDGQVYRATMNTDGTSWSPAKITSDSGYYYDQIHSQVVGNKIYGSFVGQSGFMVNNLYTASMNLDGSNWSSTVRTNTGDVDENTTLQIVGNKIYYSFNSEGANKLYKASMNIDQAGWEMETRTRIGYLYGTGDMQIIGGKKYHVSVSRSGTIPGTTLYVSQEGSNIINKGDFYGLGVTGNTVKGFANGGLDTLKYTAQAVSYSNGAASEGTINSTNWHHVAATFDGATINTYIDGNLTGSMSNPMPISTNSTTATDYPLMIGDSFNGSIDEVRISNRALSPDEIKADAQFRPYGVYTSSVIDLGSTAPTFNNFSWHEQGVRTASLENDLSTGNLVAQWNFNETSGTTAVSGGSCGASCNGTLNSFANTSSQDATPLSGWTYENRLKYGSDGDGSLMFDGVDDYVSVPDNSSLNPTGPFTVSTWFKAGNISSQIIPPIIKKSSNSSGYSLEINNGTQNIAFWVYTSAGWINSQTYKINSSDWYYAVGVYDGSFLRLYINGTEIGSPIAASNTIMSSNPLNIGRDPVNTTRFFSGVIESPKIYNRALSSDEINSNYQAGNIEFQTRTGSDTTPEDGGWDDWKSTSSAAETAVQSFDSTLNTIDPDPYTTLLLHGEGTNGSQTFIDSSIEPATSFEVVGNSQNSTAQKKFGSGSLYFDGFADELVVHHNQNAVNFGGGDFAIDFWVRYTNWLTGYRRTFIADWQDSNHSLFFIQQEDNKLDFSFFSSGTYTNITSSTTWVPNSNQWYHVALTRNGSSWRYFVDGAQLGSTITSSSVIDDRNGYIALGNRNFNDAHLETYIDEVRVSKGVARWTANFTPPKYSYNTGTNQISNKIDNVIKTEGTGSEKCLIGQTQPDAATVLLWHLEETGGSGAYIKDSSGNGNHGTPTGSTVANGISGEARSFNGSGEYISSTLNWTPTAYTVDWWIYPKTCTDYNQDILATNAWNAFGFATTSTCAVYVGTDITSRFGPTELPANTLSLNQWQHFAYTYNGTQGNFYKNGQLIAGPKTQTASTAWGGFRIGTNAATTINGLVDEFRISNVARTSEEIAETYRMGANYHITRSLSSNINLATTNNKLPIQIASDRPGTSLMLTAGESSYVNNELDTNTLGYWPLEENFSGNTNTMRECTDADAIGTACGGGKKFATGLVAMPSGCANSLTEPTCSGNDTQTKGWASATGTNEPADSTSDGLSNTNNLYNTNPPTNPSADFCHDLTKSGYTDWYLPAQTELNTLFAQRATIGGFAASYYWTSSEYNVSAYTNAYLQNMSTGAQTQTTKTSAYYYRCIRQYSSDQYKINDSGPLNVSGQAVGTSPTQGKFGKGRYFNGTSDYIRIEDPNSLLESTSFTLDAWVKLGSLTDGTNDMRIAGKAGNDSGNCGYGYTLFVNNTNKFALGTDPTGCGNSASIKGTTTPILGQWYHVVGTYDGTTSKIYVNGILEGTMATPVFNDCPNHFSIGMQYSEALNQYYYLFNGIIDEVRYSNVVRSANEIRQTYESGLRSHPITIDFGAQLDSGNLITGSGDLSFTIDATKKGLPTKGENLFVGDKIIIKENYDGTEYLAQGTVTSVNKSTGAVTVAAWDSGSTFSSSGQTGFSVNADVFKWQKEIVSIYGSLPGHRDEINKISLRILDGNQGQNIWLDDLKITTPMMTNPTTNTIQSTPNQYFQYRFFAHTTDTDPTPGVDDVELDYSTIEMTGASTSESYINTNNNTVFNIQCNGVTDSGTGDNVDCEASFNQTNWYSVGSATTPLSNQTVQGTPDISSWTGYPSGDGSVTIYARAHNTTNDTYSDIYNFNVNKDASRPAVTAITSVAGDSSSPYSDGTDNSSTLVVYTTTADATGCRWSETDQTYGAMVDTCESTTNCTLDLNSKGQKDVYLACVDVATNFSQPNWHLTYYIDTDPNIVAIDAGPSSSDRTSLTSNTWYNYSDTGSDDQISFSWTDPASPSDDYFYYLENDSSVNSISNTNLVGWWNFENDTTTTALDHSGQANHATVYGTSTSSGLLGNSRTFNGSSDYLHDNALASSIPGNLTLTGWIKTSTIPGYQARIIDIAQAGDAGLQVCIDTSGNILLENSGGPATVISGGNATDNNWHHFAVTRSDTTYEFFVDGVSKGTTSGSTPTYSQIYFGRRQTGGDFYAGQIDDAKIFTRALSSTEVVNEYRIRLTQDNYLDSQIVTEGTYYKHIRPLNGADSWGTEYQFIEKYDKTNPTLSASGTSEQWYSSNPSISLTTVDNHSGLNYSKYSWNTDDATCRSSGTDFTNNDTINIPDNGNHVLYLCNQDNVNNQNNWNGIYKLDATTPNITDIDAGQSSADRTSLTSGQWFNHSETGSDDQISYSWTDPTSPSDDYFYYLENDSTSNAFNESNLAAWWNFENDNTTTAWDHSVNGNDGTFDGSATSTGQLGGSRYFDGSDDNIQITDHSTLKPSTNLTVSAWFRTQDKSIASQQIISKTRHSGYSLSLSNTELCFMVSDVYDSYKRACVSNAGINNDTWYHVAGTFDGSMVKLYLNGQLQTQTIMTTNIYYMDSVLCIGAEAGTLGTVCENYYFQGDIDEAKIYSRTLSDAEMNNEYLRRLTTNPYLDNQSVAEGTYIKHVRPFTGAGNWGTEQQFIEKYDKTNPTVSADNSSNDWRGSNITITLSTADSMSGINNSKYSWDSDDGTCRSSGTSFNNNDTINIVSNGSHILYLCNEDNVGNQSNWNGVYKLDITTPDIVAVDAGPSSSDRTSLTSDTWFNYLQTGSDDQISFSWTDPASPSDDTFYYVLNSTSGDFIINGSESGVLNTTNTYIDSISITEDTNYMHVRAKNGADNWSTERTFIVKYDKTNPTLSATGASIVWRSANITITLHTNDSTSGLNYSKYIWDDNDAACRSSGIDYIDSDTINIVNNGAHNLHLCNQDNVGLNSSWHGTYKLNDVFPDIVSIDSGPSFSDRTSFTSGNWINYFMTGGDGQGSFSWQD